MRDGRRRPEELRDEERARGGGRRGDVSSFLTTPLRLHSFSVARLFVSSAAWGRASCESGDLVTPRAANSCSQHSAPHRRDRRGLFFSFFLFSLPPSFGPRVEEIAWIFRSNHRPSTPSVESSQLSTVAAFPSPENCAKKTKYRYKKIGDGKS